jgi:hypothetical protein
MKDQDLLQYGLTIECPGAYELAITDKEAFIKLRRNGLGASDSSVYTGVNLFTTVEELMAQKLSATVTAEELEIGNKEAVRKGSDLEPLILSKFEQWSGFDTYKPEAMYRFVKHPQLTINYDGIIELNSIHIPVEAKYVSPYANKYWNRSKCLRAPYEGQAKSYAGASIADHVKGMAELYGIPPYYFTQMQQELMGLKAPFGYLVALFDKGWELGVYKIFADPYTQQEIIHESSALWNRIEQERNNG